jgi:hypothetical protein
MPAHLLLVDGSYLLDDGRFVRLKKFGIKRCDLFHRIGGAHPHEWVVVPHPREEVIEKGSVIEHLGDHFIGSTDRPPVAAFQFVENIAHFGFLQQVG